MQSWPYRGCTDVVQDNIVYGITINVLPCSAPFLLSDLAPANVSLLLLFTTTDCSKLPFEVTGSSLACLVCLMLLSWCSIHQDHGLNFRALMYGRIQMMTAPFPAWAHTFQTMCLEFNPEQVRQEAFQVTQIQGKVSYVAQLPNSYQMTGIASPGWKVFTDGGCKRQMDGTVLAGWRIAAVSPDDFVRILCGPVV